jgi:hypothetical protein
MSHTGTVKRAFLNKHAQSHLKPARALVVESWKVLYTVVMEEGCQKSERLPYTAKLKREVIRCAEKGNFKPLQFLELMKATFDCGKNTRQQSVSVRRHEGNSLDPRKDDFLKLMMQSSRFFKRDARLDCL